jgi:DNA-binding NtrC family response regulator
MRLRERRAVVATARVVSARTRAGAGRVIFEKGALRIMLEQKHYVFKAIEQQQQQQQQQQPLPASEQAASLKLRTLSELTHALLEEVESLKGYAPQESKSSVDFADEVRRFETDLIHWALMRTGGHQRRAARLLNLKVTTLNAKIKRYRIQPHPTHTGKVVDLYLDSQPT